MKHIPQKTLGCALLLAPAALLADAQAGFLWSPSGQNVTIIAGDDIPDPVEVFPFGVNAPNFSFVTADSDNQSLSRNSIRHPVDPPAP